MLTPENRKALQSAIAADQALSTMAFKADDRGVAAALNAKTIDGSVPVSTVEIKQQAMLG
jgi:hypothetical protein